MNSSALEGEFLAAGDVWCHVFNSFCGDHRRPALFLDRDGVIVEEVLYLHRVEDVAMFRAAEVIAKAD